MSGARFSHACRSGLHHTRPPTRPPKIDPVCFGRVASYCEENQMTKETKNNRKRAFLRTLDGRAFWGLIWAKVALDQAAVVVLGKLKGSRSVISALSARCGNSVRTWRSQANGSTPQARQVSMRL